MTLNRDIAKIIGDGMEELFEEVDSVEDCQSWISERAAEISALSLADDPAAVYRVDAILLKIYGATSESVAKRVLRAAETGEPDGQTDA